MPVTSRPQDKFAFLFSGSTDQKYQNDLLNVYVTLTEYYNYPASNIWVVWGGSTDLSANFAGANAISIYSASDPETALTDAYTVFGNAVNANTPDPAIADSKNVAVIYLTGVGIDANTSIPGDKAKLVIKTGPPDTTLDTQELSNVFSSPLFLQSMINLVMQQDYADKFVSDIYTNAITSTDKTVTNVNGNQSSHGDSTGGNFTKGWISALQQTDTVMVSGSSMYADQLLTVPEPYLISLEQAKEFAQIKNSETYSFTISGETAFLGRPSFLIQDGDNMSVGWWESPDIYLTHYLFPGKIDDLYIPDDPSNTTGPYNNTINVDFRNIGSHPVRCYNLGIQIIIRTPMGASDITLAVTGIDTGTVLKPTNLVSYKIFSNTSKQTYQWPTPFYSGITHECIRAMVQLPSVPIDFTWDILANDAQAQRNTDVSSDPLKKGARVKPGDEFRGNRKHLYSIHNPFKEIHEFIITTIPEYQASINSAVMNWWLAVDGNKWKRLKFEKIENGFKGVNFILKSGEAKNIMGEFGFKPNPKLKKLRLPVEVLVDKRSGPGSRPPLARSLCEKYSAISGFTIIMTYEPANILFKVIDKKGNPVQDAKILVQTSNHLQNESIPVNKNGELSLKSINPDVYRVKATTTEGESVEQIIQLTGGETQKVKLEIISRGKKIRKKKE